MNSERYRKIIGTIVLVALVAIGFSTPIQQWMMLPEQVSVPVDANMDEVKDSLPSLFSIHTEDEAAITVAAGDFPVKKIHKDRRERIEVIPGGQSIGVRLNAKGVLVVGFHLIDTSDGQKSPAESAGIQKGDIIVKLNKQPVEDMHEVATILRTPHEAQPIEVEVIRNGKTLTKTIDQSITASEGIGQLGMYIRDSAAGVGTMTFYEPLSGKYGALGHVISDIDTKEPVAIHEGEIVRSSVRSIAKGKNGIPGEKQASLTTSQHVLGTITKNNTFGIYGVLHHGHDLVNEGRLSMPIAFADEVEEGPAKILTVVEDETVEEFDIEIVRSSPQKHAATKGMVIRITDERLLDKTGGIVQGMSGSPIIQDEKIIGAVTHVFVNDSSSGYGSHIEWMLQEAGVPLENDERKAS
ncbi:SpoIVB peptidase [Geomicrobium sp. JSM 1781026]|uniref:SpoIVB peptidase n=1 Tax=Geomicrobium sp. JSM 1781026 TaxID=3344580 RepID=UPI0035BF25CF